MGFQNGERSQRPFARRRPLSYETPVDAVLGDAGDGRVDGSDGVQLLLDVAEWRGMRRTCRRLEEGETAPLPPARRLGLLKGAVTLAGLLLLILTLALIIAVLPLLILEVPL